MALNGKGFFIDHKKSPFQVTKSAHPETCYLAGAQGRKGAGKTDGTTDDILLLMSLKH